MKNSFSGNRIFTVISVLFLLGLWKVGSWAIDSELILPSPEETTLAVINLFREKEFLRIISATILRGLIGFGISFILALVLGVAAGMNQAFNAFLRPILVTIRSTPVISLILLALIWFDVGQVPVFIALLTMFPFICTNITEGIQNVDQKLIVMAKVYRIETSSIIRDIYLPATTPFIFSGVSSAMGFGWRAIIIGEVLSQPQYGIGTFMQNAQTYLLVDRVIAWTVVAVVLSYLFDHAIRFIEKQTLSWKKPAI
ncbi:MAG: ABC transporter permease [Bacteroidales bacterium]|nr:ABC transporter permease [Bacteroidales bacterium]